MIIGPGLMVMREGLVRHGGYDLDLAGNTPDYEIRGWLRVSIPLDIVPVAAAVARYWWPPVD